MALSNQLNRESAWYTSMEYVDRMKLKCVSKGWGINSEFNFYFIHIVNKTIETQLSKRTECVLIGYTCDKGLKSLSKITLAVYMMSLSMWI